MLSSHIISKAAASLPPAFKDRFNGADGPPCYGIATDLGTTTIATYLCCILLNYYFLFNLKRFPCCPLVRIYSRLITRRCMGIYWRLLLLSKTHLL